MQCEMEGAECGDVGFARGIGITREGNNDLCSATCLLEGMQ